MFSRRRDIEKLHLYYLKAQTIQLYISTCSTCFDIYLCHLQLQKLKFEFPIKYKNRYCIMQYIQIANDSGIAIKSIVYMRKDQIVLHITSSNILYYYILLYKRVNI